MEPFAFIFVICCVLAFVGLVTWGFYRARLAMVRRLLQPLVEHYDAELLRVGLWDHAVLYLEDVPVRVSVVRSTAKGRLLRCEAPINSLRLVCRIRPTKVFDTVRRWFGGGLLTGQGAFDKVYFVEGNDADKLRETLDVNAQASLIAMYSGIEQLQAKAGQLRIDAVLPAQLLAEHSLVLLERFLGLHSHGVEFVEADGSGPVRICSESSCPVCGEAIADGVARVQCQGCHTPHHKDCWKYAGGCAIYACGSRRQSKLKKQPAS